MLKASPIRTTNASGASLFFHPFHAADLYYTLKTRRYANHLPKIPAKIIDRSVLRGFVVNWVFTILLIIHSMQSLLSHQLLRALSSPCRIHNRSAWFLNMTLEKSEKWFLLDRSLGSTARALWERSFTIISKDGGVAEVRNHGIDVGWCYCALSLFSQPITLNSLRMCLHLQYTTHLRADVMTDMSFLANTGDTAAGSTGENTT